jgi:hypothetical protein
MMMPVAANATGGVFVKRKIAMANVEVARRLRILSALYYKMNS